MNRGATSSTIKMIGLALLIALLPAITSACGYYYGLKQPEEINMADMEIHGDDSHGGGHAHGGSGTGEAGAAVTSGEAPAALFCADMAEPPSAAPVKTFELTAQKTKVRLGGGKTADAWTFDGTTPGPELRVQEGDRIVVKLINRDIGQGVTIHWHGVVLPCSQDGVPGVTQDAVWPGESYTYEFVARHAGTYWYHSHQQSSEQAKRGLVGRLIVEPKTADYAYDRDYAVTLQQLQDKHWLTNGRKDGIRLDAAPGDTVRLRLINSSGNVQWMGVAGADFQVIAMDGQNLNGPQSIREQWIPIGGGQRYDLLLTLPPDGAVQIYGRDNKALSVTIGDGSVPAAPDKEGAEFNLASYGVPLDDGVNADMAFDRTYNLELGPIDINGKRLHDIPPLVVREGEWVKIRLKHKLGSEHPMHLHGHLFKVLTKNGKPMTGSPVYADSILLFMGEEYEIAFKADNPGVWMEHCHNLEHAAAGMSMMVLYEGVTTPYRVGTKSGNLPD